MSYYVRSFGILCQTECNLHRVADKNKRAFLDLKAWKYNRKCKGEASKVKEECEVVQEISFSDTTVLLLVYSALIVGILS